jgi:predicted phage terminase large subunit-like protein
MWFTEVIPDRLNSQSDSAIVVIQQRTHEDDVSGTAITREMGYTHLMIPMRYDSPRHCTTTYGHKEWSDPRATNGEELAWPNRFPEEIVKELERDKGPYAWAGQYQQSPEPRGGSIIKREWWQVWEGDKFPTFDYILACLDTAYTDKQENDPSAMVILGVFRDSAELDIGSEALWMGRDGQVAKPVVGNPKVMMMYAWQERLEFYDLIQKVVDTCVITPAPKAHPRYPIDRLIIERKSSGPSVAQELYRMLGATGKFGIETIDNARGRWTQDKTARLHSVQHLFADKMVYAPDRSWADMVINQVSVFPRGSHDDLVDCVSMGMRYLRDTGFALRREESEVARKEELGYVSQSGSLPLYSV